MPKQIRHRFAVELTNPGDSIHGEIEDLKKLSHVVLPSSLLKHCIRLTLVLYRMRESGGKVILRDKYGHEKDLGLA